MTRSQKLKLNTITSLAYQFVNLICGFVLPKYILAYYGSDVNGLVSAVAQLLGLIGLCELGVGAVVQSALYKPLADGDDLQTSRILVSARKFFDKVGIILTVYVAVLAAVFPLNQLDKFSYLYTAALVLSMSISYFAQYFFGIRDGLLLNADQRSYVQSVFNTATLILNTVVSVIIIRRGASVQLVKLSTSLIFLIRPICLAIYVRKRYKVDYKAKYSVEPIAQKWNGLTQHFASVVLQNTDTVVLTFCSTLKNVSIYNVYNLVVTGLKQIILSLTSGVQSMFGNMLAKDEKDALSQAFSRTEWALHTVTVFAFSVAGMLIVPFVKVYTATLPDADDYIVSVFAALLVAATAAYCLRLPYSMMVLAAGHYKQTQTSAIVEMTINIVLSVALVFAFGLVGVAIGTLVSMTYRTVYYALYLRKNVINRPIKHFIKHIVVDLITVAAIVGATFFFKLRETSYIGWFILALKVGFIALGVTALVNALFYGRETLWFVKSAFSKTKKEKSEP